MKPFKSLYNRRGRYVWLLVELIVASAIACVVLDPILVSLNDSIHPYNYDYDRLVMVRLRPVDPASPRFDRGRLADNANIESDILASLPRFMAMPEVDKAIPLPERGFGGGGDTGDNIVTRDTGFVQVWRSTYIPGTDFFTTLGFKAASDIPGNPTTEQMDNMTVDYYNEAIVTRSYARILYGDEKQAFELSRKAHDEFDYGGRGGLYTMPLRIVGILEDSRAVAENPWPILRFYSDPLSHSLRWNKTGKYNVLLRLAPGESTKSFADRLNADPDLRAAADNGVLEFYDARPYSKVNGVDVWLSPKDRYRSLLVLFFAVNIFLGVFGTFWLMTGKRTGEAGILRAFGASGRNVRMMLYVEGAILSLAGSVTGCLAYLYYTYRNPEKIPHGLSDHVWSDDSVFHNLPELTTWVSDFWMHNAVVSATVIGMMLLVTLFAIAIPAWRLSRISPVDALRDE